MDSSKEIPVLDLLMAFVNYHMRLFGGGLKTKVKEPEYHGSREQS